MMEVPVVRVDGTVNSSVEVVPPVRRTPGDAAAVGLAAVLGVVLRVVLGSVERQVPEVKQNESVAQQPPPRELSQR